MTYRGLQDFADEGNYGRNKLLSSPSKEILYTLKQTMSIPQPLTIYLRPRSHKALVEFSTGLYVLTQNRSTFLLRSHRTLIGQASEIFARLGWFRVNQTPKLTNFQLVKNSSQCRVTYPSNAYGSSIFSQAAKEVIESKL